MTRLRDPFAASFGRNFPERRLRGICIAEGSPTITESVSSVPLPNGASDGRCTGAISLLGAAGQFHQRQGLQRECLEILGEVGLERNCAHFSLLLRGRDVRLLKEISPRKCQSPRYVVLRFLRASRTEETRSRRSRFLGCLVGQCL